MPHSGELNTLFVPIRRKLLAGLIIISSIFGQNTLVKIQTFFTYVFVGLTLLVLIILIPQTNWSELMNRSSGSWVEGFLPAVSIIIAGTGISWSIAAADYSCYQNPGHPSKSIFTSVTLGAFIPLFVIMSVGVLMSTSVPELATSANPIEVISSGRGQQKIGRGEHEQNVNSENKRTANFQKSVSNGFGGD
ncbi:cytosine permease [Paenibacillus larvae]